MKKKDYEADDIIGTVAKKNEEKNIFTYILTGDKDSLQIISESTNIILPISKFGKTEYNIFDIDLLYEKYNIAPDQVVDIKSLMGDASDNIPGVRGIGEKTAYSLIAKYSNLDNIYKNIDNLEVTASILSKLKEGKEQAYVSKELAQIYYSAPIELDYEKLKLGKVDIENLVNLFTRLEFKKFIDKYKGEYDDIYFENDLSNVLENFNEDKIIQITKEEDLKNYLSKNEKCSFMYFTDDMLNCKFQNNIFIKFKNDIVYFNIKEESLLKLFAISNIEKIGYNIKPLLKKIIDLNIRNLNGFVSDILIATYLLNPENKNNSLEALIYTYLKINLPELELQKTKEKVVQTSMFDTKIQEEDQNIDCDNQLEKLEKEYIYTVLYSIEKINNQAINNMKESTVYKLYQEIEIPLIQTLADMESVGMLVDKDRLIAFGEKLEASINIQIEKIYKMAGETFNINSSQQVSNILFEKLKLPYLKKNIQGYSTDKETLESLIDSHEIVKEILEYRTLAKIKSTYVDGLLILFDENSRLHTTFMQNVTATGRLSSIEPNLQNIPIRTELGGNIRKCFISPKDSFLIDADYSQIELRILAHMSRDKEMIHAFNTGEDIHTSTAAKVFDIPLESVTKEIRSKAKAVNFGIVYGISDYGLAKNINSTRKEAKVYIENYLNKYIGIDNFMKETIEQAKEIGYVETMFGRRRSVPELKSGNHNTVMFGKRVAMNMPIQGTGADIIKKAMNNIYYKLLKENFKSRIIMQVHDEIIIETAKEELEDVKQIVIDCMENVIKLDIPLKTDLNTGNNWYDAK